MIVVMTLLGGLAFAQPTNETRHYFYLIRLVGFLLIILIIGAIVDKNRTAPDA